MDFNLNENELLLLRLIEKSASLGVLSKAVFSKPDDKAIKKTVLALKSISGRTLLQAESFYCDNKAKHKNIELDDSTEALAELISGYSQTNLITTAGECSFMRSKSGKETLIGGNKLEKALFADDEGATTFKKVTIGSNNKKKQYILSGDEPFFEAT